MEVNINNIQPDRKGRVWVSLFHLKDASKYPFGKASHRVKFIPKEIRHSVYFRGLKKGEYAVSVIHDENRNGKADESILGFFEEGYGFSNNYRYFPSFKKSQINVNTNSIVNIRMVY
jgi:uncharacterized protein (DUF2141 family)